PRGLLGGIEIETSAHVFPGSRVRCTSPLFVPTQIVPAATGDALIDSIAPRLNTRLVSAPLGTPRSGLRRVQCTPPSDVDITYCMPTSSSCAVIPSGARDHAAQTSGCDDV